MSCHEGTPSTAIESLEGFAPGAFPKPMNVHGRSSEWPSVGHTGGAKGDALSEFAPLGSTEKISSVEASGTVAIPKEGEKKGYANG